MKIDFHTHILPKIDDGSRSTEMSFEMLKREAQQGVDTVLCTPHFYGDRMRIDEFLMDRDHAFRKIEGMAEELNIKLVKGSEVAFFPGIGRAADDLEALKIEGTDLLLLEMPFRRWEDSDVIEVERLIRRGFIPVIAHVERFFRYQKGRSIIDEVMDLDVWVQVNAECLLGCWSERRLAIGLFKKGEAHLLGSDCHNLDGRRPNLEEGRRILARKLGEGVLEDIDRLGEEILGGI